MTIVEVSMLIIVVEGVLLIEDMVVDGVCLGLVDVVAVIEVNRVALPVAEVEDVLAVDN